MTRRAGRALFATEVLGLLFLAGAAVLLFVGFGPAPPAPTNAEEVTEALEADVGSNEPYRAVGLIFLGLGFGLLVAEGRRRLGGRGPE